MPAVELDANSVEFWREDIAELGRVADPHAARAAITQHACLKALSGEEFCGCIHRGLLTTVDGGEVPKISVEDLDRIRREVEGGVSVLTPDFMPAPAKWCNRHLPNLAVGVHVMHHLLLNRQYSVMGPEETIQRIRGNVRAIPESHVHQALIFEIVKAFNSECISGSCAEAALQFAHKHDMTGGGVEESRHVHRISYDRVRLEYDLSLKIIPQPPAQMHTGPAESEGTGKLDVLMETEVSAVEGAVRYETTVRFKIAKEILNHIIRKRSAGSDYQPRDSDLVVVMQYPHFEVPFSQMHEEISLVVQLDEARARGDKSGVAGDARQHVKGEQASDDTSQTLIAGTLARIGNFLGRNAPKPEQQQSLKNERTICRAAILDRADSPTNFSTMEIKHQVDSALAQESGNYALHGIVGHTFPHTTDWKHEEAFITDWFRKQPTAPTYELLAQGKSTAVRREGNQHENALANEDTEKTQRPIAIAPLMGAGIKAVFTVPESPALSRSSSLNDATSLSDDAQSSSGSERTLVPENFSDRSSSGFLSADSGGEELVITPEEERKPLVEIGDARRIPTQHVVASSSSAHLEENAPHAQATVGPATAPQPASSSNVAVGEAAAAAAQPLVDVYSLHNVRTHTYVELSNEEIESIVSQLADAEGTTRTPKHQSSAVSQVAAEILLHTLRRRDVNHAIRGGLELYGPTKTGRTSFVDFPREDITVNEVQTRAEDAAEELASVLGADHSDTANAEQLAALHGMQYKSEYMPKFDPQGQRLKSFSALKAMFVRATQNSTESNYAIPHPALIEEMVSSLNQAGAVAWPKLDMMNITTQWELQNFGVLWKEEGLINRSSPAGEQTPTHSVFINCTDSNKVNILILHSTAPWVLGLARTSISYELHFSPEDNTISYKNVYTRIALPGREAMLPPLKMLTSSYAQPETVSIPDAIPAEGMVIVHKMEDMKISVKEMLQQNRKGQVRAFPRSSEAATTTSDTTEQHTAVEETLHIRLRECGATPMVEETRPSPQTSANQGTAVNQGVDEDQNTRRTPWYMAPWNLLCGMFRAIGSFIARLARAIVNIFRCSCSSNYDTLTNDSGEIATTDTHNTAENVQEERERQPHAGRQPAQQGASAADTGTAGPSPLHSNEHNGTLPQGEEHEQEANAPAATSPPSTKLDCPHKLGKGAATRGPSFVELHEHRLGPQYDMPQHQARR
ncbi:hypothetical protein [Anaplasma marginale]|uniref:hypothetical protein n=1 Tax=Anaplasma marginale TaxID=770 RepID=UPI0002E927C2|nr:hypothetical protein [Anaplasma marginale]